MNKLKIAFIVLLGTFSFSACEKDDICVEGDTPLLVIRFYDVDNPTEFKAVSGLRVIGVGKDDPVDTFADRSALDSIAIPLNPATTSSPFSFIMDSADDDDGAETGNSDALTFNYATKEEFISRACGFIANYDTLADDFTTDPENWIQSIELVKTLVQTEDNLTAHVKIYH